MDDGEELIRRRAYAIWQAEGCPSGQEARHWEQACQEMAPPIQSTRIARAVPRNPGRSAPGGSRSQDPTDDRHLE
jgi:hypothetical protein